MAGADPNRRDRILDAALRVFSAKGLRGATIKDIAGAADMAPALLYHYFSSKEAVLLEVVRARGFLGDLRVILDGANASEPVSAVLETLCHRFASLLERHDSILRLVLREAQSLPDIANPFGTMVGQGIQALAEFLRARTRTGELRAHDSRAVAQAILFTVVMSQLSHRADAEARFGMIAALLDGIAKDKRAEAAAPPRGGPM